MQILYYNSTIKRSLLQARRAKSLEWFSYPTKHFSSQFFPFDIDRSLTKFQLVNPDARQADMLTPSPYVDSSGLSPIILSSVMVSFSGYLLVK